MTLLACSGPEEKRNLAVQPALRGPHVEVNFLQMNDVYEIAPSRYDNRGGLARVAFLRKQLMETEPNLITVLAGDFLSPSLIGLLHDENGEAYAGKHMVEVLNAVGVDYVTFGNHEFDLSYDQLKSRIDESQFTWTTCNVFHQIPQGVTYFTKKIEGEEVNLPRWVIKPYANRLDTVKMGIIAMTLPFNQKSYVSYSKVFLATQSSLGEMISQCDFVVAMSHLEIGSDKELASRLPYFPLIMGGHDHEAMIHQVGKTIIAKADANAKSVYLHKVRYYPLMDTTVVSSRLIPIDSTLQEDASVKAVVGKWLALQDVALKKLPYDPYDQIAFFDTVVDVRELAVRRMQTPIGNFIAEAYQWYYPGTDCGIVNGGSIRQDDYIEGRVLQKDILSMLPFGGSVVVLKLPGKEFQKMLDLGVYRNLSIGGFLQLGNITKEGQHWFVGGQQLSYDKTYSVAMPKFVADGREANLEFLKDYKQISVDERDGINNDVRDIVIAYFKEKKIGL